MANEIIKMGKALTSMPIPGELRKYIHHDRSSSSHNCVVWLVAGSTYQQFILNGGFVKVSNENGEDFRAVRENAQSLCDYIAIEKSGKVSGLIVRAYDVADLGLDELGCFNEIGKMGLGGVECLVFGYNEVMSMKEAQRLAALAKRYEARSNL